LSDARVEETVAYLLFVLDMVNHVAVEKHETSGFPVHLPKHLGQPTGIRVTVGDHAERKRLLLRIASRAASRPWPTGLGDDRDSHQEQHEAFHPVNHKAVNESFDPAEEKPDYVEHAVSVPTGVGGKL
jgi:hypothetical protein